MQNRGKENCPTSTQRFGAIQLMVPLLPKLPYAFGQQSLLWHLLNQQFPVPHLAEGSFHAADFGASFPHCSHG